jgi:hypothetical protein
MSTRDDLVLGIPVHRAGRDESLAQFRVVA